MSKKIGLIIAVIVLIIISLAMSIYIPNKNKIEDEIEDETKSYYLLKRNDKYGVINNNGDIILEPQYDEIKIPNQHRDVFFCKKGEEQKILNKDSKELFTKYEEVEPIELYNSSETEYETKVLKYIKDGKYGLLNITGTIAVEAKYDEIDTLGFKSGEVIVKEKDKYGIIDIKGNTIIKSNYDSINSDEYYDSEKGYQKSGYIVCNITDQGYRYGYYDYEGSKVLETEYNQIIRLTEVSDKGKIYLIAAKNGQYGVYINNNKIINTQYQSISYDSIEEMFIVERTGQYGTINEKGVEILKTEYDNIQINGIYIYTQKGEEQKVFDKNGNEVNIDFNIVIETTSNPEYYIKSTIDQYSILNSNFEEILEQKYEYIEHLKDNYFIATDEQDKSGIIDEKGNIIVEFKYDTIQLIKEKNAIMAIDFSENRTDIYNNEIKYVLCITNLNIENENEYIKIFNKEEEYFLDNNGNEIEDVNKINDIKKKDSTLIIGNFKKEIDEFGKCYYIDND